LRKAVREFVALTRQGPTGGYQLTFPDFSALTVQGETLEQARVRAEYALFFHIRRLVAEGQTIPEPLSLEAIMADPQHQGALETTTLAWIEIDDDGDVKGVV
jgi:predicted RNase H-like HicB family nuclease